MIHTNSREIPERQLRQTSVGGSRFIPMLYSTPMVVSLLDKTKTETRRTQGLDKINKNPDKWLCKQINGLLVFTDVLTSEEIHIFPKVKTGDIIWVRETFATSGNRVFYRADNSEFENAGLKGMYNFVWKPSLFMPKSAARIFLKVVSVSVERLQDIDEQSAINEGIEDMLLNVGVAANAFRNYMATKKDLENDHWSHVANDAVESYKSLWQKINGKDSWDLNPFVWVYKFQRTDEPHGFR